MNQVTATLSSYFWQVPGKRVAVSLSLEVVDGMDLEVMEGFQSLPRRGLEVGGFLLGRTRQNAGSTVVEIENFEPLPCEHAVGPSYLLSATDREALERRIRSHKSVDGVSIVGFYRSHTRKDFALTVEDVDFMSAYFSKPSMVFLLIHMHRDRPPAASFAMWESRNIRFMTPCLMFPFRRGALMAGEYEIGTRTLTTTPASVGRSEVGRSEVGRSEVARFEAARPEVARSEVAQSDVARSEVARSGVAQSDVARSEVARSEVARSSPAFPHAAALMSAVTRFLQPRQVPAPLNPLPPNPPSSGTAAAAATAVSATVLAAPQRPQILPGTLSRFLRQAWSPLRLGWSAAAAILLTAVLFGVLHLSAVPGASLRPARLAGSADGQPSALDPGTKLASLVDGQSLSAAPLRQPSPDASTLGGEASVTTPLAALAAPVSAEAAQVGTPVETRNRRTRYGARAKSAVAGIGTAPKLAAVSRAPLTPAFADPPDLAAGMASDTFVSSRASELLKPQVPHISDPFVMVTIDRRPNSLVGGLLRKLPLIGKRYKRDDFVPPSPVREGQVELPAELRHSIEHPIPIDVKVHVDRDGKVEFAELLSKGSGPNRDLASLAVFAARRWEFLPAHVGEETVPAEVLLRFRFGPDLH